jgi:NAD(P)-dependent dehydrogenase (short-subunit alcohol dehydrogenase family)
LIASVDACNNGVGVTPCAMSKAAVEQLRRALRVDLVQHGVSASVGSFGFIDTEMVHRAIDRDAVVESMLAALPTYDRVPGRGRLEARMQRCEDLARGARPRLSREGDEQRTTA